MVTRSTLILLVTLFVFTMIFIISTMLPVPVSMSTPVLPHTKRVLAIGDLHGDYEALKRILQFTHYSSEDTLIQTGDSLDRGDDTIQLLEFFMSAQNDSVIQLMGNHELMNIQNKLAYVSRGDTKSFGGPQYRKAAFSHTGKYGEYIRTLNVIHRIGDVLFMHGGLSPRIVQKYNSLEEINQKDSDVLGPEGPLWYRELAEQRGTFLEETVQLALEKYQAKYIVIGHTVVPQVTLRFHGRVICIDLGISKAMKGNLGALEILQLNGSTVQITALYPFHSQRLL